jgi:hypothetical protein
LNRTEKTTRKSEPDVDLRLSALSLAHPITNNNIKMKFSAFVLSLAIGSSAAFAPSASRATSLQRFSTPLETAPVAASSEENAEAEPVDAVATMSAPVKESMPVDLPMEAAELPVSPEEAVNRIVP